MSSIKKRKERKRQSALLRQARLNLLAELEALKDKLRDKCKAVGSNNKGTLFTCDCPAAKRTREIGQELLTSINERTEAEENAEVVKEVKKVAKKKTAELSEEAVNEMKASGMTYAAIAKEFGISAPRLATLRQNWELERVRAQRERGKVLDKSSKSERVADNLSVPESSAVPSLSTPYETEIEKLKDTVRLKDTIIQEQQCTIDQLKADRGEPSGNWQKEIKDERKLLAVLLERETARIKSLVEVG